VIYTGAFFHLFSEEQQLELARRIASLLSPEPGSMIFGWQAGLKEKSKRPEAKWVHVFCHSPESWKEIWDGQVFKKGSVKVDVVLEHMPDIEKGIDTILWCVTRL
jgi:hypothetical protein